MGGMTKYDERVEELVDLLQSGEEDDVRALAQVIVSLEASVAGHERELGYIKSEKFEIQVKIQAPDPSVIDVTKLEKLIAQAFTGEKEVSDEDLPV